MLSGPSADAPWEISEMHIRLYTHLSPPLPIIAPSCLSMLPRKACG